MKFSKVVLKIKDQDEVVRVFVIIIEVVEMILCFNEEGYVYYKMVCLERKCGQCGVYLMELFLEEEFNEGVVIWRQYEYVLIGKFLVNGQEKKKFVFVIKEILLF